MKQSKKYTLTHPQKRIWYSEKLHDGTALHNIGGVLQIMGEVDLPILEKSIQYVIEVNESLRLQFFEENGQAYQAIIPYTETCIKTVKFTNCENPEKEFQNWVQSEAKKPFLLLQGPLYKFIIFEINQNKRGCLIKLHHIIADGWSMEIITNQIMQKYREYKDKSKIVNTDAYDACIYTEYIDTEAEYKKSSVWKRDREFWLETFKTLPNNAAFDREINICGERKTFKYSKTLSQKIKLFAKEHAISVNTFFITCYLLFLYKHDGEKDITIGIPVTNRTSVAQKRTVGMYTSSIPCRFQVDPTKSVSDTLGDVKCKLFHYYKHQRYPYDLIIHDLIECGHSGLAGLYHCSVNYFNNKLVKEIGGYKTANTQFYPGCQINCLNMNIKDWEDDGKFTIDFEYQKAKYQEDEILQIYEFMNNLSTQMIENPDLSIRELDGLNPIYRKTMCDIFNNTQNEYPDQHTIHALFEKQAEQNPERIAVRHGNTVITYYQLNDRANQLAYTLIKSGVKHLDYVGLMTSHSIQTLIAILAILKVGAAYVPIDPEYPNSRIRYIMEDAGVVAVLADQNSVAAAKMMAICPVICISNYEQFDTVKATPICTPTQCCDPAYVIYTSGSTGDSKGVVIEHKSLVNYIFWAVKNYAVTPEDRFPLYSSLSFDLTVTSIFTPLIAGGEIIIYDSEKEYALFTILRENKATIVKLTPSHLSLIKDMDNSDSNIKTLIVGGETLSVDLANQIYNSFGGMVKIFNEYGPTEATVGCMTYLFNPSIDKGLSVPIGRPADNVHIYILNHDLNLVRAGQIGEIYISGDGIAREYLNKPQLTSERFLDNFFIKGNRMFKTGDLAKYNSEGQVEFCGRNDSQVKIKGYRIELNEIEKSLINYDNIRQAVVIADKDPLEGEFLKAYIVAEHTLDISAVRQHLVDNIPIYMIPRRFYQVPKIPLTPNGKVDMRALNKLPDSIDAGLDHAEELEKASMSTLLIQMIQEILKVDSITSTDDFYHLGGDSIHAIQISAKLESQGYHLSVQDILLNSKINEMAGKITTISSQQGTKKFPVTHSDNILPTPILFWFLEQNLQDIGHYNQSVLIKFEKEVAVSYINSIIYRAIQKHKVFAMNLHTNEQSFYYRKELFESANILEHYDISDVFEQKQEDAIKTIIQNFNMHFDIKNDLLIKGASIYTGTETYVFLTAHHICIDAVSWLILLEEISDIAKNMITGKDLGFQGLTELDFAEWSNMLYQNAYPLFEKEIKYWKQVLDEQVSYRQFFPASKDKQDEVVYHRMQIDKVDASILFDHAGSDKSFVEAVFVSALAITLCKYTGQIKANILMESHGRLFNTDSIDVSKSIGWFTALYPFTCQFKDQDLSQFILEIQHKLHNIPNYGIGYGVLKYINNLIEKAEAGPMIFFNYLGDFNKDYWPVSLMGYGFPEDLSKSSKLSSLFDFNILLINEKIDIIIRYNKSILNSDAVEEFGTLFKTVFMEILSSSLPMPDKAAAPIDYSILSEQEINLLFE